jgi:hypothetical protein
MTKLQVQYDLEGPLSDEDAQGVANVHSYYGIIRVLVAPTLDHITVEYDATRLNEKEVEAALIKYHIPVKRLGAPTSASEQQSTAPSA